MHGGARRKAPVKTSQTGSERTADGNHHRLLHMNLMLLQRMYPGDTAFSDCVIQDMFKKPNRNGFERVLHYLLSVYDSEKVRAHLVWPIIERKVEERRFRKDAVALVNDIARENPEYELPSFSPSFLNSPGGERFAIFMWKFSMVVLKKAIDRFGGEDYIVLERPTRGLHLIKTITVQKLEKIQRDVKSLGTLLSDAASYAKILCQEIVETSKKYNQADAELRQSVHNLSNSIISDAEKAAILGTNKEAYEQVMKDWHLWILNQAKGLKNIVLQLKSQSEPIKLCQVNVESLVAAQAMPVKLETPDLPQLLQGNRISLTKLFSESLKATSQLCDILSKNDGLSSLECWSPHVNTLCHELCEVEASFKKVNAELFQLISDTVSRIDEIPKNTSTKNKYSSQYDPLNVGYQLLEEATMPTPPFKLESRNDRSLKLSICESPGVENILGPSRGSFKPGMLHRPRQILGHDDFRKSMCESQMYVPQSMIDYTEGTKQTFVSDFRTPCTSRFVPVSCSTVMKSSIKTTPSNMAIVKNCRLEQNISSPLAKASSSPVCLLQEESEERPERNIGIHSMTGLEKQSQSQSLLNLAEETISIKPNELSLQTLTEYNPVYLDRNQRDLGDLFFPSVRKGDLTLKNSTVVKSSECSTSAMQNTDVTLKANGEGNSTALRKAESVTPAEASCEVKNADLMIPKGLNDITSEFDSPPCSPGIFSPSASSEHSFFLHSPTEERVLFSSIHTSEDKKFNIIHASSEDKNCSGVSNDMGNISIREVVPELNEESSSTGRTSDVLPGKEYDTKSIPGGRQSSRRKSLQAIIDKYHQVLAARKLAEGKQLQETLDDDDVELDDISLVSGDENTIIDANFKFDP